MKIAKTVLVTGGDKGIGKAIVECLASHYEQVVLTYNSNHQGAQELVQKHSNCLALQMDLRNVEQIHSVHEHIQNRFGGVDILINNAGYDRDAVFAKMESEVWEDVIQVNLTSLFYVIKPAVLQMTAKAWGRIVNLTSIAGFTGAFGKSNYSSAKAGIIGLTRSLSLELATKGITCNAVAPGAIETDMFMRIPDKYRTGIVDQIPAKRLGTPAEVAHVVQFLVSDQASYVTGQTIHVNGGSYLH